MTENLTKRFWDNIKNSNSILSLEDAFVVWANKEKLNVDIAKKAWVDINNEVKSLFAAQMPIATPPTAANTPINPPQQMKPTSSLQIEDVNQEGEKDQGPSLIRGILTQE
ncbi:MAG: hypothetical protein WC554_10070 [Clostridia bacterium]